MTSILTNARALTALRTLGAVGDDLDTANRRVSTGARIGTAADGAAYWSIATALKGDTGSLTALKGAIGLDRTAVDVTALGLNRTLDQLAVVSRALVAAQSEQADRAKIQLDIANALGVIRSVAESSGTGGSNWLSVKSDAPGFSASRPLVLAFARQDGTTNVTSTTLDTSQFILFDTKARTPSPDWVELSAVAPTGTLAALTQAIADRADPPDGTGYRVNPVVSPGHTHTNGLLDTGYTFTPAATTIGFSINTLDITRPGTDRAMIEAYLRVVDATTQTIQAGTALLGSTSGLLAAQSAFAQQLIDINGRAIGVLTDADIEVESTRLKALQAQQSLGLNALSIANAGPAAVLSLFN